MSNPTTQTYNALARAYTHFNRTLFNATLPECLITFQRKKGAYGYFHGSQLHAMDDTKNHVDEIALNPATFKGRTREDILSTLAHEMAHLWQHHFGKPSRSGYHNKQWAAKMTEIGLAPSDTGKPGGKETGQKMTHCIIRGGRFKGACWDFLRSETMPLFQDRDDEDEEAKGKKAASKTKYTCPTCGTNAWAKPDTNLKCGECDEQLLTAEELPEPEAEKLIDILTR